MQVDNSYIGSVLNAYTTSTSAEAVQAVKDIAAGTTGEGEKAYEVGEGEKNSAFQVDYNKISALKADYRKGYDAFRQMVSTLVLKQGAASQGVMNRIFGANGNFEGIQNLKDAIASLEVDDATRAEAASLVAEDGAWGVKQVSENLLNFAKAAAGGDAAQLEKMKNAFLKGFEQAEKAWGGKLPEISYKTKEAVLKGFEE
ncbi:MAG: hypothetical protein ABFC62_09390 [Clostridiaceae bacterium]|nr:hypothetical protein [Eubacteriales bacterium]